MLGVHLCASALAYNPKLVKHKPLRQLRHEIAGDLLLLYQLNSFLFFFSLQVLGAYKQDVTVLCIV